MVSSDNSTTDSSVTPGSVIFAGRLATALTQAMALYLLTQAAKAPRSWPATQVWLFEPLLLVATYTPLIVLFGLGKIRLRPLMAWTLTAAVIIAALGHHDAFRQRIDPFQPDYAGWPWSQLWIALSISLFVAHVLVVDSVAARRLIAPYPLHFDTAWKQGVQTVLTAVFVGVFWGVLELGAELFKLLNIDFFQHLLTERWFDYPATTLALAVSIHVTDVQPALIRGARALALTLFSWLTPLLAVILLGFLGSLPFVSLQPLWRTHFATGLLLGASVMLIFLINCCYQDGAAEQTTSRMKRLAGTLGAVELVPLAGLAAWGLSLRVQQYGWTVERITAAALVLIIACYAVGYASAVPRSSAWLKRLETSNWMTAYVFLAVVLALFSPVADPARLMVSSQMARLKAGQIKPEAFDFVALRFDGARWGNEALKKLSQMSDPQSESIRSRAKQALAMTNRYMQAPRGAGPTPAEMAARITVYPSGRTLPLKFFDFLQDERGQVHMAYCFENPPNGMPCLARFVSLRPGQPEAVVLASSGGLEDNDLFELDDQGHWQHTGQLAGPPCADYSKSVETGDIQVARHEQPDLIIGGVRSAILPPGQSCPSVPYKPAHH